MSIKITRTDLDAVGLRSAASRTKDAAASRRMLALALVLEGRSRTEAAEQCGMDRQSLRDWVHRYNSEGLEGLSNRPHGGGPASLLSQEQRAEFAEIVRQGPNIEVDGVVRWRRIDLQRVILERFQVEMHERTVGKLLQSLDFRHISARPQHPEADPAAQEAHKKTLPNW